VMTDLWTAPLKQQLHAADKENAGGDSAAADLAGVAGPQGVR
jgi:hypothetical protein